ncbi:hypothetical protein [Paraglaciecola sp. MB-3u-78]|jgi:hypothetical protein|uniref:hypothetical protein n=1 Tax=Paraglaciecola sp. MB-3u-78 TaxID=2058332 RepID=UPI001E3D0FE0|nr:hypothetical protein [Paraglaciecola sp. MB-3u-78]
MDINIAICEVIYANKKFVEQIGMHSLNQVLGKSDLAFFSPHIAKQFITDNSFRKHP